MKKGILLGLPLVMIAPLLLLVLGMGSANNESVQAACNTTENSTTGGSVGIGTLNWRGASHYMRNPHPGERPYNQRVPNMVAKISDSGASIIGFQEFEPQQAQAFLEATNGGWAIVKGKNGSGQASTANAIAYQPSAWKLEETRYVSIRYGGSIIQVPLARFTSTAGPASIWVLNTHHLAGAVGGTNAMRDAAVRTEATTLTKLQAAEPNTPLFLTGNMNDSARFKRRFLSLAPAWSAANPTDKQIDWIMGSPTVTFSGTVVDQSTSDRAHKYTDHPFVHTTVQLAGSRPTQPTGGNELGVMPSTISASPGGAVTSHVTVANANIKTDAGFNPGVHALAKPSPDFITLNEIETVSLARMRSAVTGYDAYRKKLPADADDAGQAMGSAIMWRSNKWTMLDGGRVKIADNDHVIFKGNHKNWDRFAAWGVFQRTDGAVVSVIAAHHMTNPFRFPNSQWGNQPFTRAEQYGLGMDYLIQLTNTLAAYGPVLVGGDMNSHPNDGPQSAVPKLAAAGYKYTKDAGVIYNFYAAPATAQKSWQISKAAVHSDHPALVTRIAMNGARPGAGSTPGGTQPVGNRPTGCPPCPSHVISAALHHVAASGDLDTAKVAAEAAFQAGFRGQDLVTAVAIARVESSLNPKATNGTHYGLWQISAQHKGKVPGWRTRADIFDPLLNAKYAFALYSARPGSGEAKFADWIPFEKTDYRQYREIARQAVTATGGVTTNVSSTDCAAGVETGGVSGNRLARLRQRADMVIKLSTQYSSPCSVPGFDCQGVRFSGWSNACTAISMMIYGNATVGSGDGGERAYGSVVQGQQGSSWPPPPGTIVSWPYSGGGHVAIYLGDGDWVDNWGRVGHNAHQQVEKGATARWLLPPPSFEGNFLNNVGTSST